MEESQLEERLKEMRMQRENIAKVIAANSDKAVASLKDGVLLVTVPKSTAGKARPVKVEVA